MSDFRRIGLWLSEAAEAIVAIDAQALSGAVQAVADVRAAGRSIFVAGNGGSAYTAGHLALDLQKAARSNGRGTRAISLSDSVGLITAWANDSSFDEVFAEQLAVLAEAGDALLVFSVSGSSPNLLTALEKARALGMVTIGFLGKDGGRALPLVHHAVVVPSSDYGWVESAHVVLHHVLAYALRDQSAAVRKRV